MSDMGENILLITGDAKQRRRFRERADERFVLLDERDPYNGEHSPSVLSFHRLYPMPKATVERGYDVPGGGYDWQTEHWGVKWGEVNARMEDAVKETPDSLAYVFETAWKAPLPWLRKVSADYPALTFFLKFTEPVSHLPEDVVYQAGQLQEAL